MEIFKFAKVNAKTVRSNVKKMFGSILQRRFGSCGSGYFLHVFCALSRETSETFKEVFVLIHGSFCTDENAVFRCDSDKNSLVIICL